MPLLEVISTSPQDSRNIQSAGAHRIELVSALEIGGLTPSSTIVRKSIQAVDIPTMVMVRHHNNGFIHNAQEVLLFQEEIISLKQLGVKGIVIGGVFQDGNEIKIDIGLVQMVKNALGTDKIEVTFHKAFDQVSNKLEAFETLEKWGIDRVLTQGGCLKMLENEQILKSLMGKSEGSQAVKSKQIEGKVPKILLGGGINFKNVKQICQRLVPSEIHIGTCVRQEKYGPVSKQKVEQFLKLM